MQEVHYSSELLFPGMLAGTLRRDKRTSHPRLFLSTDYTQRDNVPETASYLTQSQRVLWQTVRVQSLLMEGVNTEPQPARSIRRCIALRKAPSWFNQDTEGLSKGFHILKSLKWTRDKGCEASAWIIFFKTWTFSCVGIVLKFSQNYCLWNYDYDLVKIKDCYLKKTEWSFGLYHR